MLGTLTESDWIQKGVLKKSLTDSWALGQPVAVGDGPDASIATDSSYLYVHGPFGLLKVGLGYGSTVKVCYSIIILLNKILLSLFVANIRCCIVFTV